MYADFVPVGFGEPQCRKLRKVGRRRRAGSGRAVHGRRSLARRTSALLAAYIIGAGTVLPCAGSATEEQDRFAGLQTVDDQQLGHMRGGFSVAGVDFNFGALITTAVNGAIVLQTQLVATNAGLTPITVQSNPVPNTTVTVNTTSAGATTQTVTISGKTGTTATFTTIDNQKVVNAIVSNASYQNVSQQVEFDIQLNNFSSISSQIRQGQISSQVVNSLTAALVAGIPH